MKFIKFIRNSFIFVLVVGVLTASGFIINNYTDWLRTSYYVKFEGVTIDSPDNQVEVDKNGILKLPTPSKEGYTFDGWYVDGKKWDENTPISSDITITAKWSPRKYQITFIVKDKQETFECDYGTIPSYDGETKISPTASTEYVFAGWEPAITNVTQDMTYTATYTETTRKYDLNIVKSPDGGEVTGVGQYEFNTSATVTATPKNGYIFKGWYKGGTLYSANQSTSINITSNTSLIAKFELITKNITYSGTQGATNSNPTTYDITDEIISLKPLTLPHYDFKGWYSNGQPITYIDCSTLKDYNLTAVFSPTIYTITYNLNNGQFSSDPRSTYTIESSTFTLPTPTRQHYTFKGWTENGITTPQKVVTISNGSYGNLTFTAQWEEETFDITFVVDGKSSTYSYTYGATPTYPNGTPTKTGTAHITYTFSHWDPAITTVTSDATYTAVFNQKINNYTVTLTSSPSTGGTVTGAGTYQYNTNVTIKATANSGYNFVGWYYNSNNTLYSSNATTTISGISQNISLYAKFEAQVSQYNITFKLDGKTIKTSTVNVGSYITQPTISPESYHMTGYNLDGWYTNSTYSTKFSFSTKPTSDMTLYARWEYFLDQSFYPYLAEFKAATPNGTVQIDSADEFQAYMDYVLFYNLTSDNAPYFSYSNYSDTALLNAFNASTVPSTTASISYGSTRVFCATPLSVQGTLTADPSKSYVYDQLDYAFERDYTQVRSNSNSTFHINNVSQTIEVETSNQLAFALTIGLRPICKSGSAAESIYNKAKSVLNQICDDSMSDLEKTRAIYEWLVLNVDYDHRALALTTTSGTWVKYDAWFAEGVFNNGTAVCDGIAKAFMILAKIENIPVIRCAGNAHAWNKVYIDVTNDSVYNPKWYGVDATHGDLGNEHSQSMLTYNNFLFTDAFKVSQKYTDTLYPEITANTVYNYYASVSYTYSSDTFDFNINDQDEINDLLCYIVSQTYDSGIEYLTFSFTVNSTSVSYSLNSAVTTANKLSSRTITVTGYLLYGPLDNSTSADSVYLVVLQL